ncbi:glycosyltransferase family 4 protein [Deinococcus sp. YIM 134068]|uniref:glycosyltransferase family 4 protein n=1 Tax=Deinococcus lichenicola TaxID=3118910 RepID=UPI002F94E967
MTFIPTRRPPRPHVMHMVANLDLGGSEEVALALTEWLAGECEFSFFATLGIADTTVGRDMQERLRRLNVPVYCGTPLDMKRGGMIHGGLRLRQVLRRVRPDVLHLHTDIPDGAYAASTLFGRDGPGLRVVRTIHNTVIWPKWHRVGRWVERRLEDTDIVAVSHASLEGLHRFRDSQGLRRLPGEQGVVVYNGVAARPLPPARREPGPARVLFAARMEAQKGVDLLPAILERAAALTSAPASVTLLGHGTLEASLRRRMGTSSLRWPVTFGPPVPGLGARLADYDVVLMPSRFEGLGLLGVEALIAGTPLIASDIDGLREVVPPGHELLAPPEDVEAFARLLARVVEDPQAHRERARPLSAPTAERFSPARMADAYLRIYRAHAERQVPASPGRAVAV